MIKSYKYRINPTKSQAELIDKHIGSVRFVFNLALECKKTAYEASKINLSAFDLIYQLPDLKKECGWLKEVGSQSLQQSIINLDKAFTRFFRNQSRFPKFKKKTTGGSFGVPQRVIIKNKKLIIPKFNNGIDIVLHHPINGIIKQAVISKTPTGKYFASILFETGEPAEKQKIIEEKTTIGIDLGIKTFIVTSDGKEFNNPKFLRKTQSKLKYVQRKYSKHKGKRTKHKLAILHEKVANQRKDFLHKTSIKLIKSHDSLAIEDLAVSNMVKNHKLALSIIDASWSMFVSMLEYKAKQKGNNILRIGRFEASSKTCSTCGNLNKDLQLKDREWTCLKCNNSHNRDINAAINIKSFALRNYVCGTQTKNQNELPTIVGVKTSETLLI